MIWHSYRANLIDYKSLIRRGKKRLRPGCRDNRHKLACVNHPAEAPSIARHPPAFTILWRRIQGGIKLTIQQRNGAGPSTNRLRTPSRTQRMTFMTKVTITMMSMTTKMQVARRTLRTIKWGKMVGQILECLRNWKSAWAANSITTRTARMTWKVVMKTWRLDIATSWMRRRMHR